MVPLGTGGSTDHFRSDCVGLEEKNIEGGRLLDKLFLCNLLLLPEALVLGSQRLLGVALTGLDMSVD